MTLSPTSPIRFSFTVGKPTLLFFKISTQNRLCRFYRDTKVTQITIMFEVTEAVQNYHPLGYICREKYYPRPTGIQAFVGVCHIPEVSTDGY